MLHNSGVMETGTFTNFSVLQFEAITDFRYSFYLNSQNSIAMNYKNFCAQGQEHSLLCRRLQYQCCYRGKKTTQLIPHTESMKDSDTISLSSIFLEYLASEN